MKNGYFEEGIKVSKKQSKDKIITWWQNIKAQRLKDYHGCYTIDYADIEELIKLIEN